MNKIINILTLLVATGAFCQQTYTAPAPTDGNYVLTRTYQDRALNSSNGIQYASDVVESIQYFDGLGREQQTIAIGHTPNGADLATPYQYDVYGRMTREWLPFPTTEYGRGGYKSGSTLDAQQYYQGAYGGDFTGLSTQDINAFSEKALEPSPLNRVLKQGAPGKDWALGTDTTDHTIGFAYGSNTHDPGNVNDPNNDNVRLFTVNLAGGWESPALDTAAYYAAGELSKTVTQDENHSSGNDHSTEEFTDKNGRVVLKRTYNNGEAHDTYYVYDDFGNLTYVLPPLVDTGTAISQTILDELCYQYSYDHHNRLVEKKLPGKGKEYVVYNNLDQPILTQDANQRGSNEWLFTKYDVHGRVAYTGKANITGDRSSVQSTVTDLPDTEELWTSRIATATAVGTTDTKAINYDDKGYPSAADITELLTVNYYDDYSIATGDLAGAPTSATVFGVATDARTTGLATVSLVRVLETNDWISTVTLYDDKARAIYTHSHNAYLGTVDIVENQLDFVGKSLKVKASHSRNGTTIVTIDNFTYDHMGRLLTQTQCIGDGNLGDSCPLTGGSGNTVDVDLPLTGNITTDQVATKSITISPTATISGTVTLQINPNANSNAEGQELIVSNTYDELGQLESKNVGGNPTGSGLQTADYAYNVRGWLTEINDVGNTNGLFNFKLMYNDAAQDPLFNGNIAAAQWRTANSDSGLKSYAYTYDALNRITAAIGGANTNYDVSNITYDKMGNIQGLTRNGWQNGSFANMDVLDYTYFNSGVSNQLYKVRDDGNKDHGYTDGSGDAQDYWYDDNGNMVRDLNKGIGTTAVDGITYNHLNLPVEVKFDNNAVKTISYVYDATGTKLEKRVLNVNSESSLEYAGNFVYQGGSPQFFSHPEGYVNIEGSEFHYVYQYKDHLGNVRLSYTEDPSNPGTPTIIEENNYYPFGLTHKGYNEGGDTSLGNDVANNHMTYNGKELEESLGLNWLDYGARSYQPDLGRWTSIDPASHEYVGISSYSYAANNPNVFTDPDGKRLFFVGGAGNDADGWEYITRWGNFMTEAGIRNFVRINASNGRSGDIAFTNRYRTSGTYYPSPLIFDTRNSFIGSRQLPVEHDAIDMAIEQIQDNLAENSLEEGEQFNLAGYSYGSVLQAQVALRLANDGQYIDNLILIGSPIPDDSRLMRQLQGNENIGRVLRVDIDGDLLSNPSDVLEFIQGGIQNGPEEFGGEGDNGPHFDLARPDDQADRLIQTVIQWLRQQGVE